MRTVFVDNSTAPVTFWVGSNHDHRLVKVEPLTKSRQQDGVGVWETRTLQRPKNGRGQDVGRRVHASLAVTERAFLSVDCRALFRCAASRRQTGAVGQHIDVPGRDVASAMGWPSPGVSASADVAPANARTRARAGPGLHVDMCDLPVSPDAPAAQSRFKGLNLDIK
jgi:hypothetical protein